MSKNPSLHDFLLSHAKSDPVSFHMPGHKGSKLYRRLGYGDFLDHMMDCDVTEIAGADNLFQAEGVLMEVESRYAKLYGAKRSYLQVNGSSGGIIAAILATVPKGKKIIMARNCHKSVFNALVLGDVQPVYAYPEMMDEYGISGPISVKEIERLLAENDDAEAVILPSPNYYGICSDMEAISRIVHRYNKVLIVDQAHGAHLKFFRSFGISGFPKSAEESGADIVINSIHKTLASFTESALLNVLSHRVDLDVLEDKLQAVQTTSPSYLLMASLDINAALIEDYGPSLFSQWADYLNHFYHETAGIPGLSYMARGKSFDWSKMNFSLGKLGISGGELEQILMKEYGIFIELYTGSWVMCMSGIGNSGEDMERLISALRKIAQRTPTAPSSLATTEKEEKVPLIPQTMREIPRTKVRVPLARAAGKTCASSIIPYPPGIPFICPGEVITQEAAVYILSLRDQGEKVIGVNERGEVFVGK